MAKIFKRLDERCDQWLGIDATWRGNAPRYRYKSTIQRLCRNGWDPLDGECLMWTLYAQICRTWSGTPGRSKQNWRFTKQLNLAPGNMGPEVCLERTIAQITDENWVNQVPTASGVDDTGPHDLDLIHRRDTGYAFIELKVDFNIPLYAAFQIVQYAMVYFFSRCHAVTLGYDPNALEILRATRVDLAVLAPSEFFPAGYLEWLRRLESVLNSGLENFARKVQHVPSTFRFEVFPDWFAWNAENREQERVRNDVLQALHERHPLFQ
jgi:hypothetical protein